MGDEKTEEETYSLIYASLRHPIRRRILRMLKNKPSTFSEILEAVNIDSGHLNYHLENLGDLITHSQDGKYRLSNVGSAAVKLMGGVEEHSLELSKPKLNLTKIFLKVYPLILSCALIIAGLYFIGYTTSVTKVTNGAAFTIAKVTLANVTTGNLTPGFFYSFNETALNVTSLGPPGTVKFFVENVTLGPVNATISWQELEKPYLCYGIVGFAIGLVYPGVALIESFKNLRRKRSARTLRARYLWLKNLPHSSAKEA